MEAKRVKVPNISSAYCTKLIKRELRAIRGVQGVEVNLPLREVSIRWESPATWEEIVKTLNDIEYPPEECG